MSAIKKVVERSDMKINFFYNLWGGALRDDTKNGCVAD